MIKDLADIQHKLDCKLALVMQHSLAVVVSFDCSVNNCDLVFSRSLFTVTDQTIHCTNVFTEPEHFYHIKERFGKC